MITSKVGSPVTGADFFNRAVEQKEIWKYLHGDDLLLLAPRRVGKTSLMLRLRDTAAEHGFEAAYASVAGAEDEPGFVRKLFEAVSELDSGSNLFKALGDGALGRLLKRIQRVDFLEAGFELGPGDPWEEIGARLIKALDGHDGRRLILVDELPIFVLTLLGHDPSGDRARRFLSWFRELRQAPDRQGRLRWLLAGSIGLDTVAARLRLGDTINDLYLLRLGEFDRKTARELLLTLSGAYSFPIPEDVVEHLLDRVGWLIPYYLQLIFRELERACPDRSTAPTREDVDAVIDDLLSPSKKAYFDYWRQRLSDELGNVDAAQALALLNAAAADPRGATRSILDPVLGNLVSDPGPRNEQLRYLLDVLVSDGYLVEDGDRYRFRSPLIREFWLRRVVP